MNIGDGMDLLETISGFIVYGILGLNKEEAIGEILNFFIYDSIKVLLLLIIAIFIVSIIRTFITQKRIKKILGKEREGIGNVIAAILGIPTPFCSCSAVPIFIGFVRSGIPLGITFSFLIASPLINEIAIALLWGIFGWKIALLYVVTGLIIAISCGVIIGRLGLENEIEKFVYSSKLDNLLESRISWNRRIKFAKEETKRIVGRVWKYLILAISIGAVIHGVVPADSLVGIAGRNNPFAVPIAVLIGVPLYSNAAGMVPIVGALISKGVAMGTALAFMMSVIGLSLPEMVMLRRVLKPKLLAIFIAILTISFIIVGLLFNLVLG